MSHRWIKWNRRKLLTLIAGLSGVAGCGQKPTNPPGVAGTPFVEKATAETYGNAKYRLSNGTVEVQTDLETRPLAAADTLRSQNGTVDLRPLLTRPKTPTSQTTSVEPTQSELLAHDLDTSLDEYTGYHSRRQFQLDGVPIDITWNVSLARAAPLLVLSLTLTNRGTGSVRLDQDRGDTHDGMQLMSRFGLKLPKDNSESVSEEWRYCLPGAGERHLASQSRWKTHPNARWASVTTPAGGATLVYLGGHTAPKMVVVNGLSLDYLVNEFRLPPTKSASYRIGVVLTADGRPSAADSRQLARETRAWVKKHPPNA